MRRIAGRQQLLEEPRADLLAAALGGDRLLILDIVAKDEVRPDVLVLGATDRLSPADRLDGDTGVELDLLVGPRSATQVSEQLAQHRVLLELPADRVETLAGLIETGAREERMLELAEARH